MTTHDLHSFADGVAPPTWEIGPLAPRPRVTPTCGAHEAARTRYGEREDRGERQIFGSPPHVRCTGCQSLPTCDSGAVPVFDDDAAALGAPF